MPYSPKNSGAMLQSTHGIKGNFELAMPCKKNGIALYCRNNDPIEDKVWYGPDIQQWSAPSQMGKGKIKGLAMMQSNYGITGNLEIVAVDKNTLVHYWRNDDGDMKWNGPFKIADGVQGVPSLIQTGAGKGSFEVVVGKKGGNGLLHFRRNNNISPLAWQLVHSFGSGNVSGCSLIQLDTARNSGDLELVAVVGTQLVHYRLPAGNSRWQDPTILGSGFTGSPGFIQASKSSKVIYEIVVPNVSGGIAHFSRKLNAANSLPWEQKEDFGSSSYTAVSLIQSNYGNGNLEVAAIKDDGSADHFWRSSTSSPKWFGPFKIPQLKKLRVHIKILSLYSWPIQTIMDATKELYYKIGIAIEYPTIEELDIPELIPLEVAYSRNGEHLKISDDQKLLYENRNNVEGNDIVIYFVELVRVIIDDNEDITLGGMATHPLGKPAAVVSHNVPLWVMAHEIGHLLGIRKHNDLEDTLMHLHGGGDYRIMPEFTDEEVKKMLKSKLLEEPKCR